MCLIIFSHKQHALTPLVLAANRDESLQRPTAPAGFWSPERQILAGKDLEAGGTWLGVTRDGRWAAVTNVREPGRKVTTDRSRGSLPAAYLRGSDSPLEYATRVADEGAEFAGFNLLVGDATECVYVSNRFGAPTVLQPGLYGLSNAGLDTPWPKVITGKERLQQALAGRVVDEGDLFRLLSEDRPAADAHLPDTGVGLETERSLSPLFIRMPNYGTRASSVLTIDQEGTLEFIERTWPSVGAAETRRFAFRMAQHEYTS